MRCEAINCGLLHRRCHHPHRRRSGLGVDPRTVTAGIENGTVPSVKLGRRVLIPREKFLKLFDPDD
jgi:excisionase family DNA binding protein